MNNYFIQFWVCSIVIFLFFGVNGAPFVRISSAIWVTGYNYEGWNFNFGNTPLDWIQGLLE